MLRVLALFLLLLLLLAPVRSRASVPPSGWVFGQVEQWDAAQGRLSLRAVSLRPGEELLRRLRVEPEARSRIEAGAWLYARLVQYGDEGWLEGVWRIPADERERFTADFLEDAPRPTAPGAWPYAPLLDSAGRVHSWERLARSGLVALILPLAGEAGSAGWRAEVLEAYAAAVARIRESRGLERIAVAVISTTPALDRPETFHALWERYLPEHPEAYWCTLPVGRLGELRAAFGNPVFAVEGAAPPVAVPLVVLGDRRGRLAAVLEGWRFDAALWVAILGDLLPPAGSLAEG